MLHLSCKLLFSFGNKKTKDFQHQAKLYRGKGNGATKDMKKNLQQLRPFNLFFLSYCKVLHTNMDKQAFYCMFLRVKQVREAAFPQTERQQEVDTRERLCCFRGALC